MDVGPSMSLAATSQPNSTTATQPVTSEPPQMTLPVNPYPKLQVSPLQPTILEDTATPAVTINSESSHSDELLRMLQSQGTVNYPGIALPAQAGNHVNMHSLNMVSTESLATLYEAAVERMAEQRQQEELLRQLVLQRLKNAVAG